MNICDNAVSTKGESEGRSSFSFGRKMLMLGGILFFRASLDYVYASALCPYYALYGMSTYDPDAGWLLISYALLLLMAVPCVLMAESHRPSYLFVGALFLLCFVPNTSLYYVQHLPHYFILYSCLFWSMVLLGYYFFGQIRWRPREPIAALRGSRVLAAIPLLLTLVVFLYAVYYNGGVSFAFNLADYYDMRQESFTAPLGPIWQRLVSWTGCVFAPFGVAVCLLKRRYGMAVALALFDLSITAINGMKTYLFTLVLTIGLVLVLRRRADLRWFAWAPLMLGTVVMVGGLLFDTKIGLFISNYITRRVLFTTSHNAWGFIEYFHDQGKLYELHHLLRWLNQFGLENPLGVDDVSQHMGTVIHGTADNKNPAGTIGDAYMNFGIFGLVVYPLVMVSLYCLMDRVVAGQAVAFYAPVLISTTEFMVNGNLFSVFLSYGYLPFLVYAFFVSRYGGFGAVFLAPSKNEGSGNRSGRRLSMASRAGGKGAE